MSEQPPAIQKIDYDAVAEGKLILRHWDAIIQMPSGAANTPGAANRKDRSAMATIASPRYYVYVLTRPDKKYPQGKVFYVGKGSGERVYSHDTEARSGCNCHKCRTIRKVWREGGQIQRCIIFTTDDEQEAFAYEIETIALYGRENLTNGTDGGEGGSGHVVTPEGRAGIAAAHKGKTVTAETRARISAGAKAAHARPETQAKVSASRKLTHAKPEVLAKISAGAKAGLASPEMRAKLSAARKLSYATNPEIRAKLSAAAKARRISPETRAKMSAGNKARFADPEARARLSATHKAKWDDPDYRARQLAIKAAARERKRQKDES